MTESANWEQENLRRLWENAEKDREIEASARVLARRPYGFLDRYWIDRAREIVEAVKR